jgi:hypothetical protein
VEEHILMNGKTMAYMVMAVAVGYLLIAAVPEQMAMYAAPKDLLRTGEGPLLTQGGEPELGNLTSQESPEGEVGGENTQVLGVVVSFDMYRWWAADLVVALSVYWVAKRRFT